MPLFKDTEDFATLAPVLETAQWPLLMPSIDLVERQYLRDQVLGAALYDSLHTAYQASIATVSPVPISPDQQKLLDRCRPAIAGLASNKAISKLGILFTSGGPMQNQTDTMRPASQWKTRDTEAALFEEGINYLDQLIDFLLLSGTTYGWETSAFATRVKGCLVRTVKELSAYHVDIGNSGWLLHRLRPGMLQVQDRVRDILSDAAFDDLLSAVQNGTLTGANAKVIEHARPAIILLAIAQLATVNSITIDSDGAWSWQGASGGSAGGGSILPATNERLDRVVELYKQRGEEHLKKLDALAKALALAGQYPLYLTSTGYTVPTQRGSTTPPDSSTYSTF